MPSEAPADVTLVMKVRPMSAAEVMVTQTLRPTIGSSTPSPGVQPVMETAPLMIEPVPSTRRCFGTVQVDMF